MSHDQTIFTEFHYSDVTISAIASQITGVSIVCSNVCSGTYQIKHQSSASLVFAREIHRWPVDSPLKGPVSRKMFPFVDVIMFFSRWVSDGYPILRQHLAYPKLYLSGYKPHMPPTSLKIATCVRHWMILEPETISRLLQKYFSIFGLLGTIEFNDRFAKASVNYVKNENSKWTQSMINVLHLMLV